jgi:hypothetical protein
VVRFCQMLICSFKTWTRSVFLFVTSQHCQYVRYTSHDWNTGATEKIHENPQHWIVGTLAVILSKASLGPATKLVRGHGVG